MKYIVSNKNSIYIDEVKDIIDKRCNEIFDFFHEEKRNFDCNIYLYDSIEALISGLEERGFGKFPSYMCACQKDEDNSINYFEPKDNPSENEWSKEEYKKVIFHELIHSIEFNLYGSHPEWLSEGIAKILDGTYSKGIKSLLENYINKVSVPQQKEIVEEFGMHKEYDSYDYAYLMVSYLIDFYGKDIFIDGLKDKNKFNKLYSDNLLEKSIIYFNNKFDLTREKLKLELGLKLDRDIIYYKNIMKNHNGINSYNCETHDIYWTKVKDFDNCTENEIKRSCIRIRISRGVGGVDVPFLNKVIHKLGIKSKYKYYIQNTNIYISDMPKSISVNKNELDEFIKKIENDGFYKVFDTFKTDYQYRIGNMKSRLQFQDIDNIGLLLYYDNPDFYYLPLKEQRKKLIDEINSYGFNFKYNDLGIDKLRTLYYCDTKYSENQNG